VRLQANDDEVLHSEFGRVVGAAQPFDTPFIADQQRQTVRAHRGEMGPACHEADIRAGARKLRAKKTTDRASPRRCRPSSCVSGKQQ